jgi:cyclopropane fatty-acyl-phospholipid synthase-like methyltransferase
MPDYDKAREVWDQRFAKADGYLFGREPNRFLTEQAHRLKPGQRALCLGDGEGRNGVFLAEAGLDVLAVDISPVALAKARKRAAERNVPIRFEEANLATWRWPEAEFDAVVAIFIQFAGPNLRKTIFARMRSALRPGGLILLQGYRPEQLTYGTGGPPDAENLYTEVLLRDSFDGMEILHLRAHDSEIREGTAHVGMSALIDMVARAPG